MIKQTLTLQELQKSFQSAVFKLEAEVPSFIINTAQASAKERFKVYTDAYRLRLIEALLSDYPALLDSLGDAGFDTMARAYIDESPSDQYSIRWFGRNLALFLQQTPPYKTQGGLAELAAFEWALSEAFDALETALVDFSHLAAIEVSTWPGLKLQFHPSLRQLAFEFNIPEVWEASNQKQALPAVTKNDQLQDWIIWRHQLKLLFRLLPEHEAICLKAFMAGNSFSQVCTELCQSLDEDQVVVNVAGFLQAWLRDGWVAEVVSC
ncbi:MAG: DNA-binding domain-containing protein [Methylococcaceae bacterium]|jgi:hypothetical protein